jgi:carbamoyltransferase
MKDHYYIGLNIGHVNPSACLVHNGELKAHVEEERFTREKQARHAFPINAIEYCLGHCSINLSDVEVILLGYDMEKFTLEVPLHYLREWHSFPGKDENAINWETKNITNKHPKNITNYVVENLRNRGFNKIPPIRWNEHHYCHAQAAFYSSGYERSLITVIDGVGETECFTVWEGEKSSGLKKIAKLELPESLGWIFRAFTVWAGFEAYEGEGKLMGLAPFVEDRNQFKRLMEDVIQWDDTNPLIFRVNPHYMYVGARNHSVSFTDLLVEKFGPPRQRDEEILNRHKNVAFAIQQRLEMTLERVITAYLKKTKHRNLCLAGGVALNCKANGFIWTKLNKTKLLDKMFVYPLATDDGIGIGSCMIYHQSLERDMSKFKLDNVYLGPSFENVEIGKAISDFKLRNSFKNEKQYESIIKTLGLNITTGSELKETLNSNQRNKIDLQIERTFANIKVEGDIITKVASLLAEDKIVAWFQGRMEVGPRALGNRSILANPSSIEAKNKTNSKVKFREEWRPFCPTVLDYEAENFFVDTTECPYMIIAFDTLQNKRDIIPGVVHVDGTARLQILEKEHNLKYYSLLEEFYSLTKIPVLLNTSLNIKDEPICCTPYDALNFYFATDIDALAIGDYLLIKQ